MKIKTNELIGNALDWAVAVCRGYTNLRVGAYTGALIMDPPRVEYGAVELVDLAFSSDWSWGGPIYAEMKCLQEDDPITGDYHTAGTGEKFNHPFVAKGRTKLISAMRCFVGMSIGDEVDVPDILLGK